MLKKVYVERKLLEEQEKEKGNEIIAFQPHHKKIHKENASIHERTNIDKTT